MPRSFSVGSPQIIFGTNARFAFPKGTVAAQQDVFGFGRTGNNLGDFDEDIPGLIRQQNVQKEYSRLAFRRDVMNRRNFRMDVMERGLGQVSMALITPQELELMDESPGTGPNELVVWYMKAKQAMAIYNRLLKARNTIASPVAIEEINKWIGDPTVDGSPARNFARVWSDAVGDVDAAEAGGVLRVDVYKVSRRRNRIEDLEKINVILAGKVEAALAQSGAAREIPVPMPVPGPVQPAPRPEVKVVKEVPKEVFIIGGAVLAAGALAFFFLRK
jgi:hypothetical protein